jgi:plastocyanin
MLIYRNNKKRCMKKLFVVLAILFAGILLAGCTSEPAAPVPTAAPTVAPTVATPAPTAEPTKEIIIVVVNETEETPTATPTPIPTYTITFSRDLTIIPSPTAYVTAGTKVIWKNEDPFKPHYIKADNMQTGKYFGSTEEVLIPYGGSVEVIFNDVGAYDYTTGPFQPQMQGKIIVTAA